MYGKYTWSRKYLVNISKICLRKKTALLLFGVALYSHAGMFQLILKQHQCFMQERIRHMQDMFKKERSKCRDYRTRDGHNPSYYQNSRREEWYWDAESFYANQRTNFRSMPREAMGYTMSQHYSVLGLDRYECTHFCSNTQYTCQFDVLLPSKRNWMP